MKDNQKQQRQNDITASTAASSPASEHLTSGMQGTNVVRRTCSSEGKVGRHHRTKTEPSASPVEVPQEDFELTSVESTLERIAEQARQYPEMAFTTLAHHIDVEMLCYAFNRLNPRSSPGIDRVTWEEYDRDLTKNLEKLHHRLVTRTYEPLPVRRVLIPKGPGKLRPLGLPALEDKIVAKAVSLLLEQIYEQDFSASSYGYRPGLSAHNALHDLRVQLQNLGVSHVIDCDLTAFFDTLQHGLLLKILRKRVKDKSILHLIKLWLKAGIMDGKELVFPTEGSPQGSVISPLLANIYLHEVLDEWIQTTVAAHCYGRIMFIRYADDFVIGCTHAEDVPRILKALVGRFKRYGLKINQEKTHVVPFQRPRRRPPGSPSDKPGRFSFLSFVHYWSKTRRGGYTIKRKSLSQRIARCCTALWKWCRENRHKPVDDQQETLAAKLRGMFYYYGLRCNFPALARIELHTYRSWHYWLNRRGGRRLTWPKYEVFVQVYPLPKPSILNPWV